MKMMTSASREKSSGGGGSATNGNGTTKAATGRKLGIFSRMLKKIHISRRDRHQQTTEPAAPSQPSPPLQPTAPVAPRSTRPVAGLPRNPTLKRMQSEKRERLKPYEPPHQERRAKSASRNPSSPTNAKASSRSLQPIQSRSSASLTERGAPRAQDDAARRSGLSEKKEEEQAGETTASEDQKEVKLEAQVIGDDVVQVKGIELEKAVDADAALLPGKELVKPERGPKESEPQIISASEEGLSDTDSDSWSNRDDRDSPLVSKEIEDEMEWRWILNLSMHFRDESNREKFFVTYAQRKDLRRRLTISCDYRNAQEGTLEKDLSSLKYQRDKSAKIYEAIRDSLQDIMFYDTITNLKLQTSEGRLHVHVTEDINEIIPYPPVMAIKHLKCPKYRECDLEFASHLSGFVYKVGVKGDIMIKKEIPGPDTVDEFLYEINALYALADSNHVIQFGGCVVDDTRQRVKGLLISYASQGALIDILFNQRGKLPWARREKWAKQIVSGLSEIHEAGYVQGDFTLSNIVIDEQDNAKIIDINRRGCPVGWEPPEITAMIEGLQRIGMYIGVKSDVFQLGMVLWGIAHEMDEPEATARPLSMDQAPEDVPTYFRGIVEACLADKPQQRPAAKEIIGLFPERIDSPLIVASSRYNDGRSLPAISTAISNWSPPHQQSDSYFPPVGVELLTEQGSRHTLKDENFGSLQSSTVRGGGTSSLPPVSPLDSEPFSPTTQVIEAAPSVSQSSNEDDEAIPNHLVSSISSLAGGVGLEREYSDSRASGVAIPPEEYAALMEVERTTSSLEPVMEYDRTTAGTGTPRPGTACRTTEGGVHVNGNGNGNANAFVLDKHSSGGEWEIPGTPATELLQFEDAKESFTPTDELGPGVTLRLAGMPASM
ncbi:hypothetical protein FN846DRAFT_890871 [Sphaerosporella brunnea]|uniref:Protein kinase domain-containing protein n=1 Tax=Sphaerosporella brunnea TaxID=1250544 RepID=A0A5J5EUH9_9PEZI|nr:hypothetical protein FN846DRAFT_890871 [Sphaerosporella brunnea]